MKRYATALFVLLTPLFVFAQLSPGKLSRAHSELEGLKNCSQCHARKRQVDSESCLACHTLLNERISAGKGLHANDSFKECQTCHVEHQGEDYELIWWPDGKENLDHRDAGYELLGKHKTLKCEQCHKSQFIVEKEKFVEKQKDLNRTFLGLNQACLTCHQDEHRAQMNESCTTCHTMDGWKPAAKFSHTTARYQLVGRHQTVVCAACHPAVQDNKWPDNPAYQKIRGLAFGACTDCHTDPHNNRFGPNCENCHTPNGWSSVKTAAFDHSKTQFPLLGKHQNVACDKCHTPGQSIKIARFERCTDCHADYHLGQFVDRAQGGACEECHTVQGFSPSTFTIAQHQESDYKLAGGHLAVPCFLCHSKSNVGADETITFSFSSTRCADCHANPHKNTVEKYLNKGGCEYCHTVTSWAEKIFDHAETGFALIGRHEKAACTSCHKQEESADRLANLVFTKLPSECQGCHADIHLGQFRKKNDNAEKTVTRCERCHTPIDWLADKFDHNRDSQFKLDGAHAYVTCEKCHPQATVKEKTVHLFKLPHTDCSYCHDSR